MLTGPVLIYRYLAGFQRSLKTLNSDRISRDSFHFYRIVVIMTDN